MEESSGEKKIMSYNVHSGYLGWMVWEMGFDCSTCTASASACSTGYNQLLFMEALERELCLSLLNDCSEAML